MSHRMIQSVLENNGVWTFGYWLDWWWEYSSNEFDILAAREQQTDDRVDRELDKGEESFSESDSEDDFTDSDNKPCYDN